jgi:hypothetical protein
LVMQDCLRRNKVGLKSYPLPTHISELTIRKKPSGIIAY